MSSLSCCCWCTWPPSSIRAWESARVEFDAKMSPHCSSDGCLSRWSQRILVLPPTDDDPYQGVILTYRNGQPYSSIKADRKSIISIYCDPSVPVGESTLSFLGENKGKQSGVAHGRFRLSSRLSPTACPKLGKNCMIFSCCRTGTCCLRTIHPPGHPLLFTALGYYSFSLNSTAACPKEIRPPTPDPGNNGGDDNCECSGFAHLPLPCVGIVSLG